MKVGMIFECGPAGADKAVCELLAQRLKPGIQIASVTLDNKPKLLADCGEAAALYLFHSLRRQSHWRDAVRLCSSIARQPRAREALRLHG